MREYLLIARNIATLLVTSAVTGAGVGLIEGEIVARTWVRREQISFSEGAGLFGGLVALILGPIVFLVLNKKATFHNFALIVTCSTVVGAAVAMTGDEFFVPIAIVLTVAISVLLIRKYVDLVQR